MAKAVHHAATTIGEGSLRQTRLPPGTLPIEVGAAERKYREMQQEFRDGIRREFPGQEGESTLEGMGWQELKDIPYAWRG